jgi:hypothetical protein
VSSFRFALSLSTILQATLALHLQTSSISRMKISPRSSPGLKCGSFRSGDFSISRPDRSKAEKRMGVDGDSLSPELGLELVPLQSSLTETGIGSCTKVGIGRIKSRANCRTSDDLLCIIGED